MKQFWVWALAGVLAGCAGAARAPVQTRHELTIAPVATSATLPQISDISLRAPSWVDTPALAYRLAYARNGVRESYAQSRWVASPSEMLALQLKRAVPVAGRGACRLQIEVDEFIHEFSSPEKSVGRLEARARLLGAGGTQVASKAFALAAPAASANAAGGAAALDAASGLFIAELRQWLATQAGACGG